MIKSNKLIDSPRQGDLPKWKDIILLPFIFMLTMSIGMMIGTGIGIPLVKGLDVAIGATYVYYIQLIAGFGLSILMLFLFAQSTSKRSGKTLGLDLLNAGKNYIKGCMVAGFGVAGIVGILSLMNQVEITFSLPQLGWQIVGILPIILIGWVIQGGAEEMLMRGYMLPALASRLDVYKAIIISSVVFAVLHIGNNGVTVISLLNILLCGVALALLAINEESIWGVCGFHTLWNMMQANVFGISVSGQGAGLSLMSTTYESQNIWNGGGFGIEGSILTTFFMIVFITILVRRLTKKIEAQ